VTGSCRSCGRENPLDAAFCLSCGSPLIADEPHGASSGEVRRSVTIVFCDLVGSTALGEQLDPEALRSVILRYHATMRTVVERHGGSVAKFVGDALMAVFGLRAIHEDDALRAVKAALEMRVRLEELNSELARSWGVRLATHTGVNTGEVVIGDPSQGAELIFGDAVNVAARLQQAAAIGDVLVGPLTATLVRAEVDLEPVAPLALKGKQQPVDAYRAIGKRSQPTQATGAFVGREGELARLWELFERCRERSRASVAVIVGPAGIGKSRLVAEFLSDAENRARILRGRCLPYGEGITYWPLAEIVKQAAAVDSADSAEQALAKVSALAGNRADVTTPIAASIGLSDEPMAPAAIDRAVRLLLASLAEHPLIVLIDDLHWAEPRMLDLLTYLVRTLEASPALIVCAARDEDGLDDAFEKLRAEVIELKPLALPEIDRLIAALGELSGSLRSRVADASAGNPLFIREMIQMIAEAPASVAGVGGAHQIAVPPSIKALLEARLARIPPDEGTTLGCAAVIGEEFWVASVRHLVEPVDGEDVGRHLDKLAARQLICPGGSSFAGEQAYRFIHLMVRDVAYGTILRATRAQLHERFADWAVERAGDRLAEFRPIVAHHLEQGYLQRAALGPVDRASLALAVRAGQQLELAGREAHLRGDATAAFRLFERALALPGRSDASRIELLLLATQVSFQAMDLERTRELARQATEAARALGDDQLLAHAELEEADLVTWTDGPDPDRLLPIAERAIQIFEREGNDAGLARGWRKVSGARADACQYAAAVEAGEAALAHAASVDIDPEIHIQIVGMLADAYCSGPTPCAQAMARLEELRAELPPGLSLVEQAAIDGWGLSRISAMRGDFETARRRYRDSLAVHQELSHEFRTACVIDMAGRVELLAGEPGKAVDFFRTSHEALSQFGERMTIGTVAVNLGLALLELGRDEEAERYVREASVLAGPKDAELQVDWRVAKVRLLVRRGQSSAAEALAREAVAQARDMDMPFARGGALTALAASLAVRGDHAAARESLEAALAIYRAKGDITSETRARRLVDEAATSARQ
jgi:class 3 adenylate cyclase/tetratricopeptide (TPR) repeat protein